MLAVEELRLAKQGSMDSGEFHAHVVKIAKRCRFPCTKVDKRAIRDTLFSGMNSTWARDKAINLMNEEGKELSGIVMLLHCSCLSLNPFIEFRIREQLIKF